VPAPDAPAEPSGPSEPWSKLPAGYPAGHQPRLPGLRDALFDVPAVAPADWARLGWPVRWLIASRASVLAMTLFASLFGGLLALPWTPVECLRLLLVTVALLFAHATNNLLNDHVDYRLGLDRDNYFRARYGAQPLSQGLMDLAAHRRLVVVTGSIALVLAGIVVWWLGGPAWWLAASGGLLLLFYTWPLKHFALGELAVFVVWGPLMVAGAYRMVAGDWSADVLWLACLFGLGPTVVIFAKHTDKRDDDLGRGIHTLPVLLGATAARWSWAALGVLQVAGAIGLAVVTGRPGLLLLLGAVPALLRCLRLAAAPLPAAAPTGYPAHVWPLWYTAAAFRFARLSGLLLALAVFVDWLVH
jgi:1,4-dihydroxy-2-naphthoate polyprenyltransferase